MSDRPSKFSACLRLARLSNLPTCWSNVLVGVAAGGLAGEALASWWEIVAAMVAVSLLYIAGMIFNDIADLKTDRANDRPRPIVSGHVSLLEASILAAGCLVVGLSIAALLGGLSLLIAASLAGCIIAYDLLNKRWPGTIVLMGVCRGLVYLFAASIPLTSLDDPAWRVVIPLAVLLAIYTIIITLIARREAGRFLDARKWLALAMPVVVLSGAFIAQPDRLYVAITMGVIVTFWLLYAASLILRNKPRIVPAVLAYLAGMSLVDAYFLSLLDQSAIVIAFAIGCFLLTRVLHRRIAGT